MVILNLSAGIKALEQDLRAELLVRSTRSVRLTEAGSAFLPEARTAIEALDRARAAVEPLSTGLRGSLTVGVLSGLTVIDVPALAGDFHRRHPEVRLRTETSQRGTSGLIEKMKEGHVDMPIGFGQRQAVDDAFTRAELSRRVLIEVSDITTIAEYVAHGLGVALLPPDFAEAAGDAVRPVLLADARLSWTLSVVAPATRAPTRALHAFLDLIPHHIRRDRVF